MMVLLPYVHDDDDEDNDGNDNDDDDGFLHKKKNTHTNCPLVNPQISTHFSQFATGFCAHFSWSLSLSLSLCLSNVYLSHFPHFAILHGLSLTNC